MCQKWRWSPWDDGKEPRGGKGRRKTQVLLGSYSMYGLSVGTQVEIRRPLCSQSSEPLSIYLNSQCRLHPTTSWTCVVLNNGFTRWCQLIDTCFLYWRNSIYTEEKRDVQAVRAQIQGLMVPHVLLPLHRNTVTWSLTQRTSKTAGCSTAVLRQGWTLDILPQEMLQQEC